MKLWIAGKNMLHDDPFCWEFVGVFDTEAAAVAACPDDQYFVGPALLNERTPEESHPWPGAYVPHQK